jgi:hypothetical protein
MFKKVLTSTRGYGRREEMKNDERHGQIMEEIGSYGSMMNHKLAIL